MHTSSLVSMALGSEDPALQAFNERTYALVEAFGVDPPGIQNVAIMASDFLLESFGPEARWRDLDVDGLIAQVGRTAPPLARLIDQLRAALVSFADFAEARHGVALEPARGAGFVLSTRAYEPDDDDVWLDPGVEVDLASELDFRAERTCTCAPPNRAERRWLARRARRAGVR